MTIGQQRILRIVAIFVAVALAQLVDSLLGLPITMAAFILAFWIYLIRQIWLSRQDGLKDLRYSAAMAFVLLSLTAFAVMSLLPLYEAIMVKLG